MSRPVTGIAPWYGSQDGVQDWIVPQLGRYHGLYDLCCGGCSMLLACKPVSFEVINDLHGGLINLCRVLASHHYTALQRQLERTLASEAIFNEAADWVAAHKDDPVKIAPSVIDVHMEHVQAAMYQFVVWWMGCGGMAGSNATPRMSKRWAPGGGICATRFASAVASCERFHARLKKVDIRCHDLFDVLGRIKDVHGVTVYIDPPWRVGGKAYEHNWHQNGRAEARPAPGSAKPQAAGAVLDAGLFAGRAVSVEDLYRELEERLRRFRGCRVVVRHEADERVASIFGGAHWRRLERARGKALTSAAGKAGGGRIDEMLFINGEPIGCGI